MSRTLNKVMLIGNVGKEPEIKYTPSGIPVTSFRLATSDVWKDRDGSYQESTDWHSVVAWRGLAEIIHKLVKKGARIYIEGRLRSRSFEDKSGNKKHVCEIIADNMLLLDSKKDHKEETFEDFEKGITGDEPLDYHLDLDNKFGRNFEDDLNTDLKTDFNF